MKKQITCIGCPLGCAIGVTLEDGEIQEINGYTCNRGEKYAQKEVTHPTRIVTSTVKVRNGDIQMVSVKTKEDISKDKIIECIDALKGMTVNAPINRGEVIVSNVCNTGVDIIATKTIFKISV